MTDETSAPGERARLRRLPARGSTDRAVVDAILDEGLVAHVGFVVDGQPFVIPMAYARDGGDLLLHGSPLSRLLRTLATGVEACVTVTHLDGVVLARSAFHSSLNYRSVVAFGRAVAIREPEEKRSALDVLTEHLVPGRARELRPMTEGEIAGTEVLRFEIADVTAKVRSGPPVDLDSDVAFPVWAGVIPLTLSTGPLQPAPDLPAGLTPSAVVTRYARTEPGSRGGTQTRR